MKTLALTGALLLPLLSLAAETKDAHLSYWPQWRGPQATGVAPVGDPPAEWNEEKNIRWKVDVPGKGSSSPIVWGDQVIVSTAIPVGGTAAETPKEARRGIQPDRELQFTVISYERKSGKERWRRVVRQAKPHEGTHPDGTWASNSSVTDGKHIYAHFGSHGIYCLDMKGKVIWEKDLGDMQTRNSFGEGSSPALYGNTLVINWDHEGPSFIVALDKATGKERWRDARDERTSWSTPLIVEVDGRRQVIVNATNRVRGYDLETGKIIWESGGMTVNTIPSPVHADGVVYVTSGFRGNALQAIRLSQAKGDISGTPAVLWTYDRDTPYVPSPLLYGDRLYILKSNNGILTCFDVKTGKGHYGPERLAGISGMYASPVGAAGRVYLAGRDGTTLVIKHGGAYQVLASNALDDGFDASPAVAGNELYLRGRAHLYCIAAD